MRSATGWALAAAGGTAALILTRVLRTPIRRVLGGVLGGAVGLGVTRPADGRPEDPADRRPATAFQRATLAAQGVEAADLTEGEALRRLRVIFPDWDDHEN